MLLIASIVTLVIASMVLSMTVTAVQKRQIAYRGNLTGGGQLKIPRASRTPSGDNQSQPVGSQLPPPPDIVLSGDSAAVKGAMYSSAVQKVDFILFGAPSPIVHEVTTFVMGDNLYDDSYSIMNKSGDLLGEMGVVLTESVAAGEQQNVIAFELWLFDVQSGMTSTAVVVTQSASKRDAIRQRFETRGQVIGASAGDWVTLETDNLQMAIRIVDVQVADITQLPGMVFDRLSVEIAAWEHTGGALPLSGQAGSVQSEKQDQSSPPSSFHIYSDYTLEYARKIYRNQPFTLSVSIPGEAAPSAAQKRQRRNKSTEPGGEIRFIHTEYPDQPETERIGPSLRIDLYYQNDDFQIPEASQTIRLQSGESNSVHFLVKPLQSGKQLVTVKGTYVGDTLVPERVIEELITRDAVTGEVQSVTTRTAVAHYTVNEQEIINEPLAVDVTSVGRLSAGGLTGLTRLLILLIICAVLGTLFVSGQIGDLVDMSIAGGGALISFMVSLVLLRKDKGTA